MVVVGIVTSIDNVMCVLSGSSWKAGLTIVLAHSYNVLPLVECNGELDLSLSFQIPSQNSYSDNQETGIGD